MTRVDFYHLQQDTLENVLPKLLEKAYASEKNILVRIGNEDRVELLNNLLWTYKEESFLPHACKKYGQADKQPIWLTSEDDNPNNASYLFLIDCAEYKEDDDFERVFCIFDGNNKESLEYARDLWKRLKEQDAELNYWQQNSVGKWEQK